MADKETTNYRGNSLLENNSIDMTELSPSETTKFYLLGTELAHTEKSVRDKAVDKIRLFLFYRVGFML